MPVTDEGGDGRFLKTSPAALPARAREPRGGRRQCSIEQGRREAPASQDRAASERQRQGGRLVDATRERERERERWAGVAAAAVAAAAAADKDEDEGVAAEDAGVVEAVSSGGGTLSGARRSSARSTPSESQRSE